MLNYIQSSLTLLFAISVMYLLLDCNIKQKKTLYLLRLYIVVLIVIDGLLLHNLGYESFMKLYPLLVHLPVFLAFMFVSDFKPIKVFFVFWTIIAISLSFTLVGLIASSLFDYNGIVINIVCYILYLPTWLFIYKYMRPPFLYMMRNTNNGWLGFCVIPISYTLLLYSLGSNSFDINRLIPNIRSFILAFVLIISAYYMITIFFKQTKEHLGLQSEQDLLRTQVASAAHHFEALAESQEKTILYRHDMRHHLNLINAYLVDDNKSAAQHYITSVEETIEGATVANYCNNYTVNLILSSYIRKAKKKQITVDTHIDLPAKNPISDMDLCIIFANAIENAIIACSHIKNPAERTLSIKLKIKNGKLFIEIANSYNGTIIYEDNRPVSKEENHGIGTKSIVAVVQKYDGIYAFTAEDNIFKIQIIA